LLQKRLPGTCLNKNNKNSENNSRSVSWKTKEPLIKPSMSRIAGKIVMIARSATKVAAIFYDAEEHDTASA